MKLTLIFNSLLQKKILPVHIFLITKKEAIYSIVRFVRPGRILNL